jgi:predicted PhzF superfamily epimerase YddE/YHI9
VPAQLSLVDAFTDVAFHGNPAAVLQLEAAADADWMQAVAAELNQPMTAFVVPRADGDCDLRWFTPTLEVSICGHATLATTHVLGHEAAFHTQSGVLRGRTLADGRIEMDFPVIPVANATDPTPLATALRVERDRVGAAWTEGEWWLVELTDPQDVRTLTPDFATLLEIGGVVIAFAAPGDRDGIDSVCRVFEPASGIDEDPATGSAHCVLAPLLAARTGRSSFVGEQASARGGEVEYELAGDRVLLRGRAVKVFDGEFARAGRTAPPIDVR